MEIRSITPAEIPELHRGMRYAYTSWTDEAPDREHLETVDPREVLAAFDGGVMVSALQVLSFQQCVRGVVKGLGGIAGVWTYPEYRDRGCVRALIQAAFTLMRAKKFPACMLWAFKESFYSAFGFATTNNNLELKVPLDTLLPHLQVDRHAAPSSWRVRRLAAIAVKRDILDFWKTVMLAPQHKHHHGNLYAEFTDAQWQNRFQDYFAAIVDDGERVRAIALYASVIAPPTQRCLTIPLSGWTDDAARIELMRFFAKHRDQIHHLHWRLPFGTNFYQWFSNAALPFTAEFSQSPFMVRAIGVEDAIAGLPTTIPGNLTIAASDPFCPWNDGKFAIESDSGLLRCRRVAPDTPSDLTATIQGISACIYGTAAIAELERRQWLVLTEASSARATAVRHLLQSWFPEQHLYNPFLF